MSGKRAKQQRRSAKGLVGVMKMGRNVMVNHGTSSRPRLEIVGPQAVYRDIKRGRIDVDAVDNILGAGIIDQLRAGSLELNTLLQPAQEVDTEVGKE